MASPGESATLGGRKAVLFFGVIGTILLLDLMTKALVQRRMQLYEQIEILGSYVRLTFIYNPGAAFGLHLGPFSRWIFLILSIVVLVALFGMYAYTPARDRIRLVALGLVCGGAAGNLLDRIKSARGVVDFLDVGIGATRWPVFNVADMALTVGAIVLALSLWREERQVAAAR